MPPRWTDDRLDDLSVKFDRLDRKVTLIDDSLRDTIHSVEDMQKARATSTNMRLWWAVFVVTLINPVVTIIAILSIHRG